MEKIKINKLDQRGTMLIVGIEGKEDHTMQTGWQAQEVDYFMKDVGEGGEVLCTLYDKPDKNNPSKVYHNIKDVDFSSAVKGNPQITPVSVSNIGLMSQKEIGMCAGGLMKCYAEIGAACITAQAEFNAEGVIQDLLDAYHKFVKSLEDNG